MGGKSAQVKDVPRLPGSPRILVHAYPIMGGVTVRSRPRRTREAVAAEERDASREAAQIEAPSNRRPVDGTVTLMFSDLSDYSGITDRLGDVAANDLLREYGALVHRCAEAQTGHVVKSHGDGIMVAFPSAVGALRAAVDIQQALAKRNVDGQNEELHAHIGIHAGEVVREDDDYLGSAVIIASRLADAAGPDEILVSSVVRELAAGVREVTFDPSREVHLKGIAETRLAHTVAWQSSPA
jgi:class 3 adenylate cyclase